MGTDNSQPVTALREDHRWMVHHLLQIDLELQGLHCRRGSRLDRLIRLLRELTGPRVQRHHQVENLAYERLRQRKLLPENARLPALIREHEALETLSAELLESLELCRERGVSPELGLLRQAYHYVNRQLHHHADENRLLFPLLEYHFDVTDWRAIERQMEQTPGTAPLVLVPGGLS